MREGASITTRSSGLRGIRTVALKETRELLRDPITLGIALLLPLVLLFLFGYAFDLDVREVAVAVVDQDATVESREYVAVFDRTREFRIAARSAEPRAAEGFLARGEARVVLVIPPGFGEAFRSGGTARVQTLVDGSFSATAQVIAGYVDVLNDSFATRRAKSSFASAAPLRLETRIWYNPALRSVVSIVPGLFGVILMAFPPLLTALAVVREKERGSIQQILISPLPSWAFVLGKLAPYAVLAYVDLLLILAAGLLWFGIPLRGSPSFLTAASVLYLFATLGIGLFVSTITRTQVVALLLVLVLTVMPSFMFSGFLFPIFAMPDALQVYTYLFPGRYFVSLSRGIFLKGVGLEVLWRDVALLGAYAGIMVAVASWRLRARAE